MTAKLLSAVAAVGLVAAMTIALTPTAAAGHNCPVENYSWTGGLGERQINAGLRLADAACDGYHGGSCDGKYLDYGWYGICI